MIEEKVECKRLGYEYKDLFEKIVYFIHHTPFAKDFISDYDLKMLSDLDLYLNTGKYEIIEFGTNKTRFDSSNIIQTQKEEIERLNTELEEKKEIINKFIADENDNLNNIINNLEKENIYLDKKIGELTNIIDELEKCLDKNIELNCYKNGVRQYNKTLTEGAKMFRDYIKEYLKELKEGK